MTMKTIPSIAACLSLAGLLLSVPGLGGTLSPSRNGPEPQATADRETPDVSEGRDTYVRYGCPACHGYEGQGAGTTGPRLAPSPIAFRALSAYVRRPTGNMPPYTAAVVTEEELQEIYAFLESIPDPPGPDRVLPR